MKRIFFAFIFLLTLSTFVHAQDKVPTVELNNNITTTVGNEVRLNRIEIEISDNGLKASKIKLFAGIGKTSNSVDSDTGSYLYDTYKTELVFDGTIGNLLTLVATSASQDQANAFASEFIKVFYDKTTDKGLVKQFNDLVTLLQSANKVNIKPTVKINNQ